MTRTSVADPVSVDLKALLRALKLGKLLDTLPERITLAKQQHLPHADFLELAPGRRGRPPRNQLRRAPRPGRRPRSRDAPRHLGHHRGPTL
jgi:hypothetical protein